MQTQQAVAGYLPDERPPFFKLVLFALQQIVVMFPATILVALLTGFHVSTTIFASGFATLCFILVTGRKLPLYYGSSFTYIAAVLSITQAEYGTIASDALISEAQFGIILSGLVSIAAGFVVRQFGQKSIEKVLPACLTGSIALIIGLSLATSGFSSVIPNPKSPITDLQLGLEWVILLVTLFSVIGFSVYLKKVWGQLSILLALVLGYLVASIFTIAFDIPFVAFNKVPSETIFALPHFTFPAISGRAVLAIVPIAIATIPESTAHVFQLDVYVNKLSKQKGGKHYFIADKLGLNLIGDGIGDIVSGMVGGPAGTNYGENISTMSISKNFSVSMLVAAAIITMIISFFTPLTNAIYSIPSSVISGLSIYLFGIIAVQGITLMVEKKTDFFDVRNLSVIATVLIIGLGGHFGFEGGLILGKFPAIATAAIFGILLNLVLNIGRKNNETVEAEETVIEEA